MVAWCGCDVAVLMVAWLLLLSKAIVRIFIINTPNDHTHHAGDGHGEEVQVNSGESAGGLLEMHPFNEFYNNSSNEFYQNSSNEFYQNSSNEFYNNSSSEFINNSSNEFYNNPYNEFIKKSSNEFNKNSSNEFINNSSNEFINNSFGKGSPNSR